MWNLHSADLHVVSQSLILRRHLSQSMSNSLSIMDPDAADTFLHYGGKAKMGEGNYVLLWSMSTSFHQDLLDGYFSVICLDTPCVSCCQKCCGIYSFNIPNHVPTLCFMAVDGNGPYTSRLFDAETLVRHRQLSFFLFPALNSFIAWAELKCSSIYVMETDLESNMSLLPTLDFFVVRSVAICGLLVGVALWLLMEMAGQLVLLLGLTKLSMFCSSWIAFTPLDK